MISVMRTKRLVRFSTALRHLTHQPTATQVSSFGNDGKNLQDRTHISTANAYYKVNNQSAIDYAAAKVKILTLPLRTK